MTSTTTVLSGANIFMGVFFLYATAMQLNDPDAYLWIGIYITAALLSFSKLRKSSPVLQKIHAIFTIGCLSYLVSRYGLGMVDMDPKTEIGRENLGLMIVVFWSLISSLQIIAMSPVLAAGVLGLSVAVLSSVYVIPKLYLTMDDTQDHCAGIGFSAKNK